MIVSRRHFLSNSSFLDIQNHNTIVAVYKRPVTVSIQLDVDIYSCSLIQSLTLQSVAQTIQLTR